jgi:nitrogen regulatory protein P-II 1
MTPTLVKEPTRQSTESEAKPRSELKLVTAIIRPEKLGAVTDGLNRLHLARGFTVSEVRGSGCSPAATRFFRGIPFVVQLASEVKIEIIAPEDRVHEIAELIQNQAQTGRTGDGKIWVTDVGMVIRIRTAERGLAALS